VLDDRDNALAFWTATGFTRQAQATRFTKLLDR
jgi:hypothetical protein